MTITAIFSLFCDQFPSSVEHRQQSAIHEHSSPVTSNLKTKDRTVLGRGAGSSSSSSPNVDSSYLYSIPNKKNKSSRSSALDNSGSPRVQISNGQHNHVKYTDVSLSNGSPQVQKPNEVYGHMLYSDVQIPSSFSSGQLKDPLKSSEIVLQSINEQQHSTPLASPMTTTAEVYEEYQGARGGERQYEPWEDQLSDVGQGMRQQLRDGVWSEENDSFDDGEVGEEAYDGEEQQQQIQEDQEQPPQADDDENELNQYSINDIQLGTMIGKGSFGKVFEADVYRMVEGEEKTRVVVKVETHTSFK